MVDAPLIIGVREHFGDIVSREFILSSLFQHTNRGQVSQDPALLAISIMISGTRASSDTQKLWCCTGLLGECDDGQWALAAGKSIENTEIDTEASASDLKVLYIPMLDDKIRTPGDEQACPPRADTQRIRTTQDSLCRVSYGVSNEYWTSRKTSSTFLRPASSAVLAKLLAWAMNASIVSKLVASFCQCMRSVWITWRICKGL